MSEPKDVQEGSGNVFADLGVPDREEALAKAELARHSGKFIKRQGLTQVELPKLLGRNQPKVSALIQGRLASFSTDEGHQSSIKSRSGMISPSSRPTRTRSPSCFTSRPCIWLSTDPAPNSVISKANRGSGSRSSCSGYLAMS
jgi:predicted XRE-type DNA-binding protein